jgi:flagellar hook-basal body complex protein FliE
VIAPIAGIGPLGASEWSVGGVSPLSAGAEAALGNPTAPTGSESFGSVLTHAVNSMENTQANATQAAQGLATGTLTDPTQAVTAVENAALEMDFAAQIRDKLDSAVTTIFQTQM